MGAPGKVIREVSPDRGTLTYWYDEAGNLTKLVDGDGQETNYAYDNANRLTSAAFVGASAETITYSYDSTASGNKGVGRLTGVTEESGSSAFAYDAQGRVTQDAKTIQGRSYTVGYAYDRNGRITGLALPSGRSVTFTRATDGQVTDISTKATPASASQTLASGVSYLPFGPLASLTYGNGLGLTYSYDQNYWLSRAEVKSMTATRLDLTFNRNENGQLTGVVDNASSGRGATFTYTDAGRLASGSGPWGADTYSYDAAGNRLDRARDIGGTITHVTAVPSSTSNRIDTVTDGSTTTRTLTYRTGGDLSQAVFAGGPTYVYQYNARKRLSVVKNNGTDAAWYGYDYAGRRVWRSVFGTTTVQTHYIFDEDGRLVAEHDGATGAVVREYVWLDDEPVAMIDSSSGTAQTYFIHSGQIGEPLVMTDASQAKVWDAYVEPYGQAQVFGTPSAGLDLRLPGQWLEAETGGLHQNWMRNYDPSLGRYVEADPLGIEAGKNSYAYVDADPLSETDQLGLWEQARSVPAGTIIAPYGEAVVPLNQMSPSSREILQYRYFVREHPGEPWWIGISFPPVGYRVAKTKNASGAMNGFIWYPTNCPKPIGGREPRSGMRVGMRNPYTQLPYFRVFNSGGQPISPVTGRTVSTQSHEAHYPLGGVAPPSIFTWSPW